MVTPDTQDDMDAAWRDEFRRRIEDIESGRVQPVSHDETVAMARSIVAGRQ